MTPLRKWYFAVDERGIRHAAGLLRAAVVSCRTHTDLAPHLLYYGPEAADVLDDLRALGVTIIPHVPSLERELRIGYGPEKFDQFVGHWLRLDIPDIERDDEVILYTDIDILFQQLPPELPMPRLLAAGPAEERRERGRFNSGVMLMNLPSLREVWPDFMAAVRERLLGDFRYPAHDQVSFNSFFKGRIDWLADDLNWRPYWGLNPSANIIHYHGPKPPQVRRMMRGHKADPRRREAQIWRRDPAAYAHYVELFERYAGAELPPRAPVRPTVVVPPAASADPDASAGLFGRLGRLFGR